MTHFDIDRYAHLDSPIHKFDPRIKLISILVLIFSIVLLKDIKVLLICLLIAFSLVLVSKIPLRFLMKRLRWVLFFILALSIIMVLTLPGDSITSIYFFRISEQGLTMAFIISLKALSVMLLIFPMLATVRFDNFIKTLDSLKLPNKLVQIITFSYRYIFVILNELQRSLRSIESRGFRSRTNRFTIKVLGNAIGMLLVRSYERSERVHNAMVSRGYDGSIKTLTKFEVTALDWLKGGFIIALAPTLHIIERLNLISMVV